MITTGSVRSALVAVLGCLAPLSAVAHTPARLMADACPECSIGLDTLVLIEDPEGRSGLSRGPMARTRSGLWLVASGATPGEFAVFSADGAYVRSVGRSGGGPGEYRGIVRLIPTADGGVRVVDSLGRRITRLDSRFEVVSTAAVGSMILDDLAVLSEEEEILLAFSHHPRRIGLPLHRLTGDELGDSFGSRSPEYRRDRQYLSRRRLAYDEEVGLWTALTHQYRLEQWDPWTGEFVGTVTRAEDDWIPSLEPPLEFDVDSNEGPNGGIMGLHVDGAGLAWVLLWVPDTRWRDGLGDGVDPWGRTKPDVIRDSNLVYDTVVEVIDLATGRALARTRIDRVVTAFTPSSSDAPLATLYQESPSGEPRMHVVSFRLDRGGNQDPKPGVGR